MSFSETIFLFVLALLVFGPKKLPEIARTIGKALNEFRRASNEFKAQIEQEIAHLEVEKTSILPPAKSPEGTASRTLPATVAPVEESKEPLPKVETPAETPAISATENSDESAPTLSPEVVASVASQEPHA